MYSVILKKRLSFFEFKSVQMVKVYASFPNSFKNVQIFKGNIKCTTGLGMAWNRGRLTCNGNKNKLQRKCHESYLKIVTYMYIMYISNKCIFSCLNWNGRIEIYPCSIRLSIPPHVRIMLLNPIWSLSGHGQMQFLNHAIVACKYVLNGTLQWNPLYMSPPHKP